MIHRALAGIAAMLAAAVMLPFLAAAASAVPARAHTAYDWNRATCNAYRIYVLHDHQPAAWRAFVHVSDRAGSYLDDDADYLAWTRQHGTAYERADAADMIRMDCTYGPDYGQ